MRGRPDLDLISQSYEWRLTSNDYYLDARVLLAQISASSIMYLAHQNTIPRDARSFYPHGKRHRASRSFTNLSRAQRSQMSCLAVTADAHDSNSCAVTKVGKRRNSKATQELRPTPLISHNMTMCSSWVCGEDVSDRGLSWSLDRCSQLLNLRSDW